MEGCSGSSRGMLKAFTSSSLAAPATMWPASLRARAASSGEEFNCSIHVREMAENVLPL